MRRHLHILIMASSLVLVPCMAAMGQTYKDRYGTTNNGVNRGYVGSESMYKKQMESAQRRQLMKQSMERKSKNGTVNARKNKPVVRNPAKPSAKSSGPNNAAVKPRQNP
ncbi:MAG: hypothetical protein AAGU11_09655 [Syntrophobacteraceae bacterium]